ncbi:MAG: hypothetical protein GWP08_18050 [Nitrospiraceae bacterium]|nr:hypothetical protein [Nitrospiraceae bacterium]
MQPDSVQAAIVNLASRAVDAALFRAGQTLQGIVEGSGTNLSLLVRGARLPLPEGAALTPGQAVSAEVVETPEGIQLRVAPLPTSPAATSQGTAAESASPASPLAQLVATVLESLGVVRPPESVVDLLPPQLPQTDAAIRLLVTLFAGSRALGGDLELLTALLEQAAQSGAVPQSVSGEAAAVLLPLLIRDAGDLGAVLQRVAVDSGRSVEGRVAQALASGDLTSLETALRGDVRALIGQLRNHEGLLTHFRQTGQLRVFQEVAERVVGRLSSIDLQNVRGVEQPYAFVELPFSGEAGVYRAHIHFFGEGGGKRRRFETANGMVAFDLSTTRLGDLWIALRSNRGYCECRLSATSEEVVQALDAASGELAEVLRDVGYERVTVSASLWDGDRLRETVALMRRFSGLNVVA